MFSLTRNEDSIIIIIIIDSRYLVLFGVGNAGSCGRHHRRGVRHETWVTASATSHLRCRRRPDDHWHFRAPNDDHGLGARGLWLYLNHGATVLTSSRSAVYVCSRQSNRDSGHRPLGAYKIIIYYRRQCMQWCWRDETLDSRVDSGLRNTRESQSTTEMSRKRRDNFVVLRYLILYFISLLTPLVQLYGHRQVLTMCSIHDIICTHRMDDTIDKYCFDENK